MIGCPIHNSPRRGCAECARIAVLEVSEVKRSHCLLTERCEQAEARIKQQAGQLKEQAEQIRLLQEKLSTAHAYIEQEASE